jgi:rod shape-determining protein MreC
MKQLLRRWWPLVAAALLTIAAFGGVRALERARSRARRAVAPVAKPLATTARAAVAATQAPDEVTQLKQELAVMKLEYAALEERLARAQLRGGKLVFPRQRLAKLKPAALLYRDPSSWFRLFVLDVGSVNGVRTEAGVLTAAGVIGKLTQIGEVSSQVLLLSDHSCRFSARLARTGLQCAVSGDGRRGCLLQYLGGQDDVRVGDSVETGAGSRSFPSGVPVGRVVRVVRLDGGLRLQAEVEPFADLSRLQGMYVWVGEPKP